MKRTKLKIWNFGASWMRRHKDPMWNNVPFNGSVHGYVCARSKADAALVIDGYCGSPPTSSGMRDWSPMWGYCMDGVVQERGLWLQFGNDAPVRVA